VHPPSTLPRGDKQVPHPDFEIPPLTKAYTYLRVHCLPLQAGLSRGAASIQKPGKSTTELRADRQTIMLKGNTKK